MAGIAPTAADCEAYWKLEDLTDSTGNGYTLTNVGSTTGATGILGDGIYTDGVNDNFYINNSTLISNTKGISFWYKPTLSPPAAKEYIFSGLGGTGGIRFWHNSDGTFSMMIYDGTIKMSTTAYALTAGEWYHFAVFFGDGNVYHYINGSQVYTNTFGTVNWTGAIGFKIGSSRSDNAYADGIFDEICIFNDFTTANLADNVTYLYNSGAPTSAQQYPFSGATSPTISKINGTAIADINKINGVAKTSISKFMGVSLP